MVKEAMMTSWITMRDWHEAVSAITLFKLFKPWIVHSLGHQQGHRELEHAGLSMLERSKT